MSPPDRGFQGKLLNLVELVVPQSPADHSLFDPLRRRAVPYPRQVCLLPDRGRCRSPRRVPARCPVPEAGLAGDGQRDVLGKAYQSRAKALLWSADAIRPEQLPGAAERNPIVLATFRANSPPKPDLPRRRKRVLYYGHYDVVSATASERWKHDPWKMSGQNGWLYGRGVTDNKGPTLAIAAAASELRRRQELEVDLVMVVEGEEETGSAGFQEAIRAHRVSSPMPLPRDITRRLTTIVFE